MAEFAGGRVETPGPRMSGADTRELARRLRLSEHTVTAWFYGSDLAGTNHENISQLEATSMWQPRDRGLRENAAE